MLKLKRAIYLVWESTPVWSVAKVILMLLQGLLPLASLYLTKLVVDTVAASLQQSDPSISFESILPNLGFLGMVTIVMTITGSIASLVNTIQSMRVTEYMEDILHAKTIAVDLEHYENAQYYDILQRAQQEAPERPTQILNRLTQIGQSCISLIAMVGLLLSFHWGLAGVLFVVAIPTVLVRLRYAHIMYRWRRDSTPLRRQTNYYSALLTSERPAKEIRLFNLGSLFSQRVHHLRRQLHRERLAINIRQSIADLSAQITTALIVFAAYGFIVYQTLNGILTLGDLVLYHQAFKRGQGAFQGVLRGWSDLHAESLYLTDLYEFLDLTPSIVDPQHPISVPQPMHQGIVVDHVSFQYTNTSRQALNDISLTILPGETIALVGENGCGKTTLIKLLCRLYEPTAGRITLDGHDLSQFGITPLRRQVSVIFQDYMKYHLTAQENIWLGNIDLLPTDAKISKAAFRSGADDVINSLPNGYDTMLGKLFDQGEELSIGQWQKIALARAFLRDSQIIVLDEPTSALDPKAEYEVFKKFHQLMQGQTTILISHRLSNVKMADRIYVMDQGFIVESGTHKELIDLRGTYATLFETQAKNYR